MLLHLLGCSCSFLIGLFDLRDALPLIVSQWKTCVLSGVAEGDQGRELCVCECTDFPERLNGDQMWQAQLVLQHDPPQVQLRLSLVKHRPEDALKRPVAEHQVGRAAL